MSTKYPGGIISKTAPVPSGPYNTSTASGIWTLDQMEYWMAQSLWPTAGNAVPYKLWSWGQNNSGALGNGNTNSYSSPVQVGTLTNWLTIAGGVYSALALKTDGSLWGWGKNNNGQLGLGNTTNYSSPKQAGLLTTWASISANRFSPYSNCSFGVKTDGTLWAWGRNEFGQLGLGNNTYYSSPKQVGALTNWLQAASSYAQSMAIKTDGTLWSLGGVGNSGMSGLGNVTRYSSPKQVGSLTNWAYISAGTKFFISLKTDGTLWSWGKNSSGECGVNSATSAFSSPVQIGALTTWVKITCGDDFGLAVKNDGTIWSWGGNFFGQLGLNVSNTLLYSSPKQVGSLTNWSTISGGNRSPFAIKTNKTLWCWGANSNGQLGLGNTTNYSSPKQVGSLTNWYSVSAGSADIYAISGP